MTQVVAMLDGVYGGKLRKPGDHFQVTDPKHKSDRWMAEVGTKKYDDFIRAFKARGGEVEKIDKITGERVSAGGVAEQLAVALEQNRALTAKVVELEAEMAILKKNVTITPTPGPTPADGHRADEEQQKPVTRRRRHKKDDD